MILTTTHVSFSFWHWEQKMVILLFDLAHTSLNEE